MSAIKDFYQNHKTTVNKGVLVAALFLGVYFFVNYLLAYIAPFLAGFIISLIAEKPVAFMSVRMKMGRGVSSFLFILVFLGLLFGFGYFAANAVISQGIAFVSKVPDYLEDATKLINNLELRYDTVASLVPAEWVDVFESTASSIIFAATDSLSQTLKSASTSVAMFIPNFIIVFLIVFVSAFFFIKDRELIQNGFRKIAPNSFNKIFRIIKSGMFKALFGFIKARFILLCIISGICILGFAILRQPYAIFLGLIIGVFDAFPVVGVGTAILPWAAISLIRGDIPYVIGLLVIYGAAFITRQIVGPKIISEQIGLHPILTLMSIYVGLKLFGFWGLFVGPMAAIFIKVVLTIDFSAYYPDFSSDKK